LILGEQHLEDVASVRFRRKLRATAGEHRPLTSGRRVGGDPDCELEALFSLEIVELDVERSVSVVELAGEVEGLPTSALVDAELHGERADAAGAQRVGYGDA
jgi:hypothetical protein